MPLKHPAADGPELTAPAHDHGSAADNFLGHDRERVLAHTAIEAVGAEHPAVKLLFQAGAIASAWTPIDGTIILPLPPLSDAERRLLVQVLGSGEVVGQIGTPPQVRFAEAVCPGLWWIEDEDGAHLEIGGQPSCLDQAIAALPPLATPIEGAGLMNAMPVLHEIRFHTAHWQRGLPNHVISLTLLPMSAADQQYLAEILGEGTIAIESRGYGFAHVTATGARGVWRVRYYNSMGAIVQDTLEVGGLPIAAIATSEDIVDGGRRLLEILDTYC